jgi:hypothetical protein
MTNREKPALTDVFLRLEHDSADPDTVTSVLGLAPTHCARRGQQAADGKSDPYPWNVWVLSSAWSVPRRSDVRDHFQWLLASIGSRAAELRTLRNQGHRIAVHCTWIGKGGYGGPDLSPQILRGLADLDLEVYFDVSQVELRQ